MFMKNVLAKVKEKMTQRYTIEDENLYSKKSTNINILLNRVRLDQKRDFQKNILFSLFLVGLICSIAIYLII